ncbi:hypothetical protein BROUX41_000232 [Berkeleyomyces rouxiae]|uniref:uncharacterized protein n=1 Tax=Berkeleyomyces rouxiae TaxID=2035830 RepID=UPI003B7D475C
MPVELRKRKAPTVPAPPPPAKRASRAKKEAPPAVEPVKRALPRNGATIKSAPKPTASAAKAAASVGDIISLADFGGEVQTQDDETVTLKSLLTQSKTGVVLFTYPRASTPGCTRQACLFRDNYTVLSNAGLGVYGLSSDSPKANTTFKTKQKLPYRLLCDPSFSLIGAIGLKKNPKGTVRGVFLVDKNGKVLIAQPGGPADTLDVVVKLIEEGGLGSETLEENLEPELVNDEKANGHENGKEDGDDETDEKQTDSAEDKSEDKTKDRTEDKVEDKLEEEPQAEIKTDEVKDVKDTASKPEAAATDKDNSGEESKEAEGKPEEKTDDKPEANTDELVAEKDETTAAVEDVKTTTESTAAKAEE